MLLRANVLCAGLMVAVADFAAIAQGVQANDFHYSVSWLGNSYSGANDKWVQNFFIHTKVQPDGTVNTWSHWLDHPQRVGRVVYIHGRVDPKRGGWFTTASGNPQIQIQTPTEDAWQTVARRDIYPDVPGDKPPAIGDFARFGVRLQTPVLASAVRILGRPDKGSRPDKGRSSSCAELQAWGSDER